MIFSVLRSTSFLSLCSINTLLTASGLTAYARPINNRLLVGKRRRQKTDLSAIDR